MWATESATHLCLWPFLRGTAYLCPTCFLLSSSISNSSSLVSYKARSSGVASDARPSRFSFAAHRPFSDWFWLATWIKKTIELLGYQYDDIKYMYYKWPSVCFRPIITKAMANSCNHISYSHSCKTLSNFVVIVICRRWDKHLIWCKLQLLRLFFDNIIYNVHVLSLKQRQVYLFVSI